MPFQLELEIAGTRLSGNDHYWQVIRRAGARRREFTLAEVIEQTAAHKDSVGDFLRRLVRAGYVEQVGWREVGHKGRDEAPTSRARLYRLVRAPAQTPSLRRDGSEALYGRGRQQMWNILRGPQARRGIDANNLQLFASTNVVPVSLGSAKEYLRFLAAAGYLRELARAANHRLTVYQLIPSMNSGPEAPKLLRARGVYDPNRKAVLGSLVAEEVGR